MIWKRVRISHKAKQDPVIRASKQADMDMLELAYAVEKIQMGSTELIVIIQNRCLETWFLGNRKIYSRQPQSKPLLDYTRYYDISSNCPELMGKYEKFNTHAQFHEAYLKELFKTKNINYSKKNPGDVVKLHYLEQLLTRIQDKNHHLPSFKHFINFCNTIRPKLSI